MWVGPGRAAGPTFPTPALTPTPFKKGRKALALADQHPYTLATTATSRRS